MNRLTRRGKKNKDWVLINKICSKADGSFCPNAHSCDQVDDRTCPYLEVVDRLCEYEDALSDASASLCKRTRIGESKDRTIDLPCAIGETVYVVTTCENIHKNYDNDYFTGTGAVTCPYEKDCQFEECVDENQGVFAATIRGAWVEQNLYECFCNHLAIEILKDDIGKTVFFTREAAEAALEKMRKEKADNDPARNT